MNNKIELSSYLKKLVDYANVLDEQGFYQEANRISSILETAENTLQTNSTQNITKPIKQPTNQKEAEEICFKVILASNIYSPSDQPEILEQLYDKYNVSENNKNTLRNLLSQTITSLEELDNDYRTKSIFAYNDESLENKYLRDRKEIQTNLAEVITSELLTNN